MLNTTPFFLNGVVQLHFLCRLKQSAINNALLIANKMSYSTSKASPLDNS